MIVILLHGPMGSGKTTVANRIIERFNLHGRSGVILPFAGPLKKFAKLMGWNGEKDAKGRRLLQLLGTECGRECISQTLWSDKWKESIIAASIDNDFVVCDDLRFMSEYDAAKELSLTLTVITIKLKGRGYAVNGWWKKLCWTLRSWLGLLHPSERPIPDYMFDIVFDNGRESPSWLNDFVEQLFYRVA